ncbi:MAG: NAD(P)/FAD-dependent oxidoreductase [Hyphomicrobiaceae bacterium]
MHQVPANVAIIGAGIVGVATAIYLQREGVRVTLIDKAGPGEGASFGNGGVLASCSIVPITVPGLIRKAPQMLIDPEQPLFLKWSYLPKLAPWLIKYLSHCKADETRRIADAIHGVVSDSLSEHQALAAGTGAEHWIKPCDYLYVYNSREHFEGDAFGWSLRRAKGIEWDELEGDNFWAFDPLFDRSLGFAVKMGEHGRITDPGRYVKDLAAHFESLGGNVIAAEAREIDRANGMATGVRISDGGTTETIRCDAVVICAGAWSERLAKTLGVHPRLESERGYHVELYEPNFMPRAPVMIAAKKFVATPMDGRLRLAGVVEFGGLEAPASRQPFELLKRNAKAAMPDLSWKETREWMGHRPAPADSIPIIGEAPDVRRAYLGFGHHHIGLTAGPKTGRLLAGLISGRMPNIDLAPYSPERFN